MEELKLYLIEWIDTNFDECTPAIYAASNEKEAEDRFIKEYSRYFYRYEVTELSEVDGHKIKIMS